VDVARHHRGVAVDVELVAVPRRVLCFVFFGGGEWGVVEGGLVRFVPGEARVALRRGGVERGRRALLLSAL
jgi:hypothetical protein